MEIAKSLLATGESNDRIFELTGLSKRDMKN